MFYGKDLGDEEEKQTSEDKTKTTLLKIIAEDREHIENSKKNTDQKIREWEEDLKEKWKECVKDDAGNTIKMKYDPMDEFDDEFYSKDGKKLLEELKSKWEWKFNSGLDDSEKPGSNSTKKPFDIEKASLAFSSIFGLLKDMWMARYDNDDENLKTYFYDEQKGIKTKINFENWFPHPDKLILSTTSDSPGAKKKKYNEITSYVAYGGLAAIGILMILSISCASTNNCGTEIIKTPLLLNNGTMITLTETHSKNIPQSILESQFIVVLISLVIAPTFARTLKDKYDIQIGESQTQMILTDALNSVKMYSKEANNLRDKETGKISEVDQRKLRNLAFASLESNYTAEKYKDLVGNVGSQIFEKAIEKAVESDKLERFPFEKSQVEEIIKQAIDAYPIMVKWKDTDEDLKKSFIDCHVRRLLKNVHVEGWAYGSLENVFDAEANKRLLAAAVADKNNLLQNLTPEDQNLKYLSIVLSSISDSIAKPPPNASPSNIPQHGKK